MTRPGFLIVAALLTALGLGLDGPRARADEPAPDEAAATEEPAAEEEATGEPAAEAEAEPPDKTREIRLFYQSLTAARVNPLGLQSQLELDLRFPLYDPGDSKVLANNFAGVTAALNLSPATSRVGIALKVRPLNIFKLEIKVEHLGYFGTFGLMASFDSARDDFSDSAVDRGEDADLHYATDGWQATFDLELRARVGPVVVRSRFKAAYIDVSLERGNVVWYDQFYDLALPHEGWFYLNDADILLQLLDERLIVGVRHAFGAVDYPSESFRPGESRKTNNTPTHRLGPLIAYRFSNDPPGPSFNQPTILLLVNWYLQHRWRTGKDVDQAIPYFVLGFAFNGDLL